MPSPPRAAPQPRGGPGGEPEHVNSDGTRPVPVQAVSGRGSTCLPSGGGDGDRILWALQRAEGTRRASAICSTTSAGSIPRCTYGWPLCVTVGRIPLHADSGMPRADRAARIASVASVARVRPSLHVCMSITPEPFPDEGTPPRVGRPPLADPTRTRWFLAGRGREASHHSGRRSTSVPGARMSRTPTHRSWSPLRNPSPPSSCIRRQWCPGGGPGSSRFPVRATTHPGYAPAWRACRHPTEPPKRSARTCGRTRKRLSVRLQQFLHGSFRR